MILGFVPHAVAIFPVEIFPFNIVKNKIFISNFMTEKTNLKTLTAKIALYY